MLSSQLGRYFAFVIFYTLHRESSPYIIQKPMSDVLHYENNQ
jgi:hypothetical protein